MKKVKFEKVNNGELFKYKGTWFKKIDAKHGQAVTNQLLTEFAPETIVEIN